jgi:hypothetical protein
MRTVKRAARARADTCFTVAVDARAVVAAQVLLSR